MKKQITKATLVAIAAQPNRVVAVREAGISLKMFYRSCHKHGVSFKRSTSSYKLSDKDKALIRTLVGPPHNLPHREVARKFEISHTTVGRCVNTHA